MIKEKINLKVIVTSVLVLALVACLGVTAFAEEPGRPACSNDYCPNRPGMNGHFGGPGWDNGFGDYDDFGYGYDSGFGYDDFDMFDMMDVDSIINDIDDEDLKAEIQKLYDEYIEAQINADTAKAALEESLRENGLMPGSDEFYGFDAEEAETDGFDRDDMIEEKPARDEQAEEKSSADEKEAEQADDFDVMFEEFLKWYKNNRSDI